MWNEATSYFLYCSMVFKSLDVDCRSWACRAHILAVATTYALSSVDAWHHGRVLVVLIKGNHGYCLGGAVLSAVAAGDRVAVIVFVASGDAQEMIPYGISYL